MVSISSTSAKPMDHATADCFISAASRSRQAASSFLESSIPGIRDPGANTTAAAATGPAKGLMPASSTPATREDSPSPTAPSRSAAACAAAGPPSGFQTAAARQRRESTWHPSVDRPSRRPPSSRPGSDPRPRNGAESGRVPNVSRRHSSSYRAPRNCDQRSRGLREWQPGGSNVQDRRGPASSHSRQPSPLRANSSCAVRIGRQATTARLGEWPTRAAVVARPTVGAACRVSTRPATGKPPVPVGGQTAPTHVASRRRLRRGDISVLSCTEVCHEHRD